MKNNKKGVEKMIWTAIALFLVLAPASLVADVIASSEAASPETWSGYWVGTFTGIPGSGSQTVLLAQQFTANGNYDDISLDVQLEDIDQGTVDFAIVQDDNGLPGAILGTTEVTIEPQSAPPLTPLLTYDLSFAPSLDVDGTYWIVASSPSVEPFIDSSQVPMWALSACVGAPDEWGDPVCGSGIAVSDGTGWQLMDGESFAFELQGNDPPAEIPEPQWTVILVPGALLLAARHHRISRRRPGSGSVWPGGDLT